MEKIITAIQNKCFHCGQDCKSEEIQLADKSFCCTGCKTVYSIINQNNLEYYYCLNDTPGVNTENQKKENLSILDREEIAQQFILFKNNKTTQVSFYLPQIHCSSCLWILENLHLINKDITYSKVQFTDKKVAISFQNQNLTVRQVAEMLSSIGYEPYLSITDDHDTAKKQNSINAKIKLGVVGFCFGNIMLISFPEYLGLEFHNEKALATAFRFANFLLALPVFFYGAKEFFVNSLNSYKQKYLNIDVPVALALLVTFSRSVFEVFTNTGAGYFDSMSGIVFFMLLGRTLQNATNANINFNRNYKSYFPIAVTVVDKEGETSTKKLKEIEKDDIIRLHFTEIIPTDGWVYKNNTQIDYSFISGENEPVTVNVGDIVYAGGKIMGNSIELLAMKPFEQNSFIQLWNNEVFHKKEEKPSFIHGLGKYFTLFVILLSIGSFIYWYPTSPNTAWNAFTAILIIACPCALLLAASFINSYAIAFFSKYGFFVKNEKTIEHLKNINHIVFDKTGTITEANESTVQFIGEKLSDEQMQIVVNIARQSIHPLSKAIAAQYENMMAMKIENYKEISGAGIEAYINDVHYKLGSAEYVRHVVKQELINNSQVFVSINNEVKGKFIIENKLKPGVPTLLKRLEHYKLSLLSGDTVASKQQMQSIFPNHAHLLYQQSPQQKLEYIKSIQTQNNDNVLMLGDGLNDAGALQQSNVGISVISNNFSFASASQGLLHESKLPYMDRFIKSAKSVSKLILYTFMYSVIYNLIGIYFSVQGLLHPIVAAIIMSASSLSIIGISYFGTKWIERKNMTNVSK